MVIIKQRLKLSESTFLAKHMYGANCEQKLEEKKRGSNGEVRRPADACEAADVGGLEEVDDGAEQLVGEHRQAAQRRVPPAVPRREHRRRPGRIGGLGRFTRAGSGCVRERSWELRVWVGMDAVGRRNSFIVGSFSKSVVDAYWIRRCGLSTPSFLFGGVIRKSVLSQRKSMVYFLFGEEIHSFKVFYTAMGFLAS